MRILSETRDSFADHAAIPSHLMWGNPSRCPDPRVTVIMPVYKRPEMFAVALNSVLHQDYADSFEVVVVDNNEDNPSPNMEVVRRVDAPHVLYYHNERNLGMTGNWNRGIELARAPFVTYCHDDDLLLPGALSLLMNLQKKTGTKAILSVFDEIDESGNWTGTTAYTKDFLLLHPRSWTRYSLIAQYLGNITNGDGSLYHRASLVELGGFDSARYPAADYAMNVAYAHAFGAVINNVPTSQYRISDNESRNVYQLFPPAVSWVREVLKPVTPGPRSLVDRFVRALDHNTARDACFSWGGGVDVPALSFSDRVLLETAKMIARLRRYGFRRG